MAESVHEALGKEGKAKKPKLLAHKVEYERAHNGGFHAHVHMHDKATGQLHHVEHHIAPSMQNAQAHMEENMGDQPDFQGNDEPEGTPESEGAGEGSPVNPAAQGAE